MPSLLIHESPRPPHPTPPPPPSLQAHLSFRCPLFLQKMSDTRLLHFFLQALLGQEVVITLADGSTRTGTVYTVDPVHYTVALLMVRAPPCDGPTPRPIAPPPPARLRTNFFYKLLRRFLSGFSRIFCPVACILRNKTAVPALLQSPPPMAAKYRRPVAPANDTTFPALTRLAPPFICALVQPRRPLVNGASRGECQPPSHAPVPSRPVLQFATPRRVWFSALSKEHSAPFLFLLYFLLHNRLTSHISSRLAPLTAEAAPNQETDPVCIIPGHAVKGVEGARRSKQPPFTPIPSITHAVAKKHPSSISQKTLKTCVFFPCYLKSSPGVEFLVPN